jgi:hypothetical protein
MQPLQGWGKYFTSFTQGSSFLATLGWMMKPLWGFLRVAGFASIVLLLSDFSAHAAGTGLAGKHSTSTIFSGTTEAHTPVQERTA